MVENARDWWNFQFFAEQDPDDPTSERIVFYGPNPNSDSQNGWESTCLYRYDPAIDDAEQRGSAMANCINSEWDYVFDKDFWDNGGEPHDATTCAAVQSRWESSGDLFTGGEEISNLFQAKDGTILVAGTFRQNIAGTLPEQSAATSRFKAIIAITLIPSSQVLATAKPLVQTG